MSRTNAVFRLLCLLSLGREKYVQDNSVIVVKHSFENIRRKKTKFRIKIMYVLSFVEYLLRIRAAVFIRSLAA